MNEYLFIVLLFGATLLLEIKKGHSMNKKVEIGKEPVRLRMKNLKNGNKSLYLDIYFEGNRRYEFLKLYLKPNRKEYKAENAATLQLANAIKAKRIVELQNKKHDFFSHDASNADLLSYMILRARRSQGDGQGANRGIVGTAIRSAELLKEYTGRNIIPFKTVDKKFILGYVEYLRNATSRYGTLMRKNTQYNLFMSLVSALNSAMRSGIILSNPATLLSQSERPSKENSTRTYLTIEELKRLYETDYPASPYSKRLFLFGCMCGLRYSDIMALRWKNLSFQESGVVTMSIRQKKTSKEISVPLCQEAIKLLPEKGESSEDDFVFRGEGYIVGRSVHDHLQKWAKMAGITKHISFHVARHTYATMLLTLGADLYTVSKLLGHTNIKTTQIYAEVIDQKKRDAVDLIPSFQSDK